MGYSPYVVVTHQKLSSTRIFFGPVHPDVGELGMNYPKAQRYFLCFGEYPRGHEIPAAAFGFGSQRLAQAIPIGSGWKWQSADWQLLRSCVAG